jgi:sirohydrochlorin cobaltochelatase
MVQATFADATLVLFAHGSTVDAESSAPVYAHAADLRRRGSFAEVREAFWKQEPRLAEVVASSKAPRVFLLPLFISEGYFSEVVIPQALGFRAEGQAEFSRRQQRGSQTLFYCKPVGTHDSMIELVLTRAREVVEKFPFPRAPNPKDTTLFIAGHGTSQNENSRKAIERQVELARARTLYAAVEAVFLEEEPRIGACYQIARTRNIVVVPFFISDGMHARQDIPVLLGEPQRAVQQRLQQGQPTWRNPTERNGLLVWYAASVGTHPQVAEVILCRVEESCLASTG